jgi:hypothetical protein
VAGGPFRSCREDQVLDQTGEIQMAISALTAEIVQLADVSDDERTRLSVTIENAFGRLAAAMVAQASHNQEPSLEEALPGA